MEGFIRCVNGGFLVPVQRKNILAFPIGITLPFDRAQLYVFPHVVVVAMKGHCPSLVALSCWSGPIVVKA
jgi:hypothetical protein